MIVAVDPDVARVARRFGIDPLLVQAVVRAEGDIVKAVQCSLQLVGTREQAIDVVCRSAVHMMCDFLKADPQLREQFVIAWGHRWAPVGAANDPHGLNQYWPRNVSSLWA